MSGWFRVENKSDRLMTSSTAKNVNGKTMKKEIKNVAVQEWERRQGMNSGRAKGKL